MSRSFDDWLNYLNSLSSTSIDLSLVRIQPIAEKMELTQFNCPVITVAGTNGKGSCVRILEWTYLKAGYQVAAYTSPHLLHFNERLRINDEVLAEHEWVEAFEQIEKERGETALTFFEFTTLAALWLCQQRSLDLVILEVGLGGRLDAVNVVQSDLAIITTIDFDHQEYLGDTREAIAKEKAGIFKERSLAVCGDQDIPLSIFESAEQKNVSLYCLNHDYFYEVYEKTWVWLSEDQRYDHLSLPQLNLQDTATAIMAIKLLQKRLPMEQKTLQLAPAEANLSGRFEAIKTPVAEIYLDVAHNPHAVQHLVENLQKLPSAVGAKTIAIFGMLQDKDAKACIDLMLPWIDEWYVVDLPTARAYPAASLAELVGAQAKSCYTFASVEEALRAALQTCQLPDRVIIFGSFYTVAAASEWLQHLDIQEQPTIERGITVTPQMRHRIVGLLVLLGLVALFLPLLFSNEEPIDNVANLSKQVPKAPPMPVVKMEINKPDLAQSNESLENGTATTSDEPSAANEEGMAQVAPVVNAAENTVVKPVAELVEAANSNPSSSPSPNVAAPLPVTSSNDNAAPVADAATLNSVAGSSKGVSSVANSTASSSANTGVKAANEATKLSTDAMSPAAPLAENPPPSMPVVKVAAKTVAPTGLAAAPTAWTIQVASYANNQAAQVLVKRLRNEGFTAYTREATLSNGKRMTRVFVGPEISQAKVKQMQVQLARRFKLSGVIMKYSVN